eukprot:187424-Chlamydomonas_euryale.AAC.2
MATSSCVETCECKKERRRWRHGGKLVYLHGNHIVCGSLGVRERVKGAGANAGLRVCGLTFLPSSPFSPPPSSLCPAPASCVALPAPSYLARGTPPCPRHPTLSAAPHPVCGTSPCLRHPTLSAAPHPVCGTSPCLRQLTLSAASHPARGTPPCPRHPILRAAPHPRRKPGNLMLDSNTRRVKIVDFGSAVMHNRARGAAVSLMGPGTLSCTPAFRSPESLNPGYRLAYALDMWALGVTLFLWAFGELPFKGTIPFHVYEAIRHNEVALPAASRRVSAELCDLLLRLLRKNPAERLDVKGALEHAWVVRSPGGASAAPAAATACMPPASLMCGGDDARVLLTPHSDDAVALAQAPGGVGACAAGHARSSCATAIGCVGDEAGGSMAAALERRPSGSSMDVEFDCASPLDRRASRTGGTAADMGPASARSEPCLGPGVGLGPPSWGHTHSGGHFAHVHSLAAVPELCELGGSSIENSAGRCGSGGGGGGGASPRVRKRSSIDLAPTAGRPGGAPSAEELRLAVVPSSSAVRLDAVESVFSEVVFEPGTEIIELGAPMDNVLLILDGEVELYQM